MASAAIATGGMQHSEVVVSWALAEGFLGCVGRANSWGRSGGAEAHARLGRAVSEARARALTYRRHGRQLKSERCSDKMKSCIINSFLQWTHQCDTLIDVSSRAWVRHMIKARLECSAEDASLKHQHKPNLRV